MTKKNGTKILFYTPKRTNNEGTNYKRNFANRTVHGPDTELSIGPVVGFAPRKPAELERQCFQIENVKYQQLKKEKSESISTPENRQKSAQLDANSTQICTPLSHCICGAAIPQVIIIIKLYDFT